ACLRIRLCSSNLCGTGPARSDRCYCDARCSGLHSAVCSATDRGLAATICLCARLQVRLHARVLEPRLLGPMVVVESAHTLMTFVSPMAQKQSRRLVSCRRLCRFLAVPCAHPA